MKKKQMLRILTDVFLTVSLLLLMAYSLIGEQVHEWIGILMFGLFILHHVLNKHWSRNLLKGKYTPLRVMQTVLIVLVLVCMLSSMVSGIILSRYIFDAMPIQSGRAWGRTLHMLSAYWGFMFMSLHLGFYWNRTMGAASKLFKKPSSVRIWILRGAAVLTVGYGTYAFIHRDIGNYMFLGNQFVFFDFEEPVVLFMVDYIAVMGLFVVIGHYCSKLIKRLQ